MGRFAHRLFTLGSLLSLLLCALVCALWAGTRTRTFAVFRTAWSDVTEANGPEGGKTHWIGSSAGRVHFFARDDVFIVGIPTTTEGGALYGVTSDDPNSPSDFVPQARVWSTAGIEVWSGPPRSWPPTGSSLDIPWRRVSVPHWMLAAATAVPPGAWLVARARRFRRRAPSACATCGYDLRATPGRCTECGRMSSAFQPT